MTIDSPSSTRIATPGAGLARCITVIAPSRSASRREAEKWSAWVWVSMTKRTRRPSRAASAR